MAALVSATGPGLDVSALLAGPQDGGGSVGADSDNGSVGAGGDNGGYTGAELFVVNDDGTIGAQTYQSTTLFSADSALNYFLDDAPISLGAANNWPNITTGTSHVVYTLVNRTPNPNPNGSKYVCNYLPVAGCATKCMPTTAHTFTENSCTNYANSTIWWIQWGSSPAHYMCIPSPSIVSSGTPIDGNLSCYDSPPK
jgi:hypothetical protein